MKHIDKMSENELRSELRQLRGLVQLAEAANDPECYCDETLSEDELCLSCQYLEELDDWKKSHG